MILIAFRKDHPELLLKFTHHLGCKSDKFGIFGTIFTAAVTGAQSIERLFKGPSKRCSSLTDGGSNPSRGLMRLGKILAAPSMCKHGNKYGFWEVE